MNSASNALLLVVLASAALGLAACKPASGEPVRPAPAAGAPDRTADAAEPHGRIRFDTPRGTWLLDVELARTPERRARGLMWRTALRPDTGMLFLFDRTEEHSFWMRNTLLSLDMIFLDEDRLVVGVVEHAEPRSEVSRSVGKPSRYVIEVAAGEASAHAVGPGARASFQDVE